MTDDEITEARAYVHLGLSVLGDDGPAREARAQARRAAAEVLTELRITRQALFDLLAAVRQQGATMERIVSDVGSVVLSRPDRA